MDAKEIALQTFKDNFYKLSEVANNITMERVEDLVNNFLDKMKNEKPELITRIIDPDIQYAVINAQRQYARSGHVEAMEILTTLLKERFQVSDDDSLKRIIINESIEAMSKLTVEHIKLLTIVFLVKSCILPYADLLFHFLSKIAIDKWDAYKNDENYFDHFVYVGVATKDIIVGYSKHFEVFLRNNYDGVPQIDVNPYEEDVAANTLTRQKYITDTKRAEVLDKWNNSMLRSYSLSGVGKSLAITYINSVMGENIDFSMWIKN